MPERSHAEAQIILIEHEPFLISRLSAALESAGYRRPQKMGTRPLAPADLVASDPDLVVFDVSTPNLDSYGLLEALNRGLAEDTFLPVLAVGSGSEPEAKERAIRAGAKDFLTKPVDAEEFLLHVHALLDTRFTHERLKETRRLLEEVVRQRTGELRQAHLETIDILGRVAELRDDQTGKHTKRVARLSGLIAAELHLSPEEGEEILRAAPLHDLGKVAIADAILLKKGRLDSEERKRVRAHASLGADLLVNARSNLLRRAREIALYHHERWDGLGYPEGLAGQSIPLAARIVAVADAFDALLHSRPYKEAWPRDEALAEIERESGGQFDPHVVDALLRIETRRGEGIVIIE
jgi:putative two-component system response regulator